MSYVLTFLEGIVTFISPCLLPLLPVYIAYVAGGTRPEEGRGVARVLVGAVCFVLGFATLFSLMGAFAGTLGSLLLRYRTMLDLVCGAVLVVLGLGYLGVVHISLFDQTRQARAVPVRGPVQSFVFGVTFALCWTPCVGTFLASALSLAASSGSTLAGVGLLLSFSAGLGLPFVISAVLVDQLEGAFTWVKQHYETINKACGVLLVVSGVLVATGLMGSWMTSAVLPQ